MRYLLVLLLLCAGCSPSSVDECHHEASVITKKIITDLRDVQTKEDLKEVGSSLKKYYEQLVDIMIIAKKLQAGHESEPFSDTLLAEYKRVYEIDGARALMEDFQRESLHKLDAYEKTQEQILQHYKRG